MRIVYDSNNRIVGATDAWANSYPTKKLAKGKYTVKVAIRHTSIKLLEGAERQIVDNCARHLNMK